jgi:hypothetical protein
MPSPATTTLLNIEAEPEDVLKVLLGDEVTTDAEDVVEPILDD